MLTATSANCAAAYYRGDDTTYPRCRCNNSPGPLANPAFIRLCRAADEYSQLAYDYGIFMYLRACGTPRVAGTLRRRRGRLRRCFRLLNGRHLRGTLNRRRGYDKIAHFKCSYSLPRPLSLFFSLSLFP